MTVNNPPVFVISLERSADRRAAMAERLDPLGIDYSFFEAVDGSALDLSTLPTYCGILRRLFFGRDLTRGEMGCLLSHRAVYQHIVDNNIPAAVVLEDDTIIAPDFPAVVNALTVLPFHWDVIRFLAREKIYKNSRDLGPLNGLYSLIRIRGTPGGAYGYLLTLNAAQKFLEHTRRNWLPIDTVHGYVWRTGLEVFAVKPSPVRPDDVVDSTIGGQRFDKTVKISGWQRAAHPLARSLLKLYEMACKNYSFWRTLPRDIRIRKILRSTAPPESSASPRK